MAREGKEHWEVTAVAPSFFRGDLRPIALESMEGELCLLRGLPCHFSRWPHLFVYGLGLRKLLQEHWDIVHCWEEPFTVAGGEVARWTQPGSCYVFFTFQNICKRYPSPFARIEKYCLDKCAGWIGAGKTVVEVMLRRGCSGKPYRMLPVGVDTERFRPDRDARRQVRIGLGWYDEGPPVIGFSGRFVEEKGLDLMMRLLDGLSTPWRALFLGGGPLEPALRQWSSNHRAAVRIVTGKSHDEVPAILNAMDILMAPSQTTTTWREQLGRMLIEAFSCGIPVVASDSGEIPHVVGDAGVIVGECDEPAWRRAVGELLESPARRLELGRRGLERAHAVYAWPVIARQHLDFFDELLA
jgi:glycosyltransferase involved in cell wall biosynthesis